MFGITIYEEQNKIMIKIDKDHPDLKSKKKSQLITVNGKPIKEMPVTDVKNRIKDSGNTVDLDISLDSAGLTKKEINEKLREIEKKVYSELSSNDIYTEDDLSVLEDTDQLNLLIELLEQYSRDVRESYDDINKLHFFNFEDLKEGLNYKICDFKKKAGDRNKTECSEEQAASENVLTKIISKSIHQLENFKVFVESKKKYEKLAEASANSNSNSPKRQPQRAIFKNLSTLLYNNNSPKSPKGPIRAPRRQRSNNLSLTSSNTNSGERKSSVRKRRKKTGSNKDKNQKQNKSKKKKKK